MPELEGQLSILDAIKDELGGDPTPARAIKILDEAHELGWTDNPYASFVIRLTRSDALPFYARWDLSVSGPGKKSWRFAGARAQNGQPLAFNDIRTYLSDPDVVYPEPPDSLAEAAEHEDPGQTMDQAVKALDPIAAVPAASNWGAILG